MSGSRTVKIEILGSAAGARAAFGDAESSAESFGSKLGGLGKVATVIGTAVVATAGLVGAAAWRFGTDFENAFAGVVKTVDGTEAELQGLRDGIRRMAMELPASASSIADVAAAAGQLGIEIPNILGFTRVMIDLGEATNLSAEEAATQLARLANITGMSQDDFDRLGSSIVALGNNFATTEAEIVSMGMRLAGAGSQIGLSEAQIMGFAAAMSSVGIEAEAGGTAFSKVMISIASAVANGGDELTQFADIAGMSASQFANAFQDDAAGAIIAFVSGLGDASASGENLFGILEDLGFSEVRVRDALMRLAGASGVMTDAVATSSAAWDENTALATEAAMRYETVSSRWQILKNQVIDLAIGLYDQLRPAIVSVLDSASTLVTWMAERGMPLLTSFARAISGPIATAFELARDGLLAFIGALQNGGLAGGLELVAGGLASLFERIDWGGIASTVAGGLAGALVGIGARVWDAGQWLYDLFERIDWGAVAGVVLAGLSGALSAATGLALDAGSWFLGLVQSVNWSDIASEVLSGLSAALSGGTGLALDAGSWFLAMVQGVAWGDVASEVLASLGAALSTAGGLALDAGAWFADAITGIEWGELASTIKGGILDGVFAIVDWGGQFYGWIFGVISGIGWSGLGTTIKDGIVGAFTTLTDWAGQAYAWLSGAFASVEWSGISTTIKDGIVGAAGSVDWSALGQSISGGFSSLTESNELIATFATKLGEVREAAQPLVDFISSSLSNTLDSLRQTWDGVKASFEGVEWGPILEALKTLGTVLGAVLVVALLAVVQGIENFAMFLSVVLPAAVSTAIVIIETIAGTINLLRDTVENTVAVIRAIVDGDWSEAWSAAQTLVSDFASGVTDLLDGLLNGVFGIVDRLTGGALTRITAWVTDMRTQVIQLYTDFLEWIGATATDCYTKISSFVTNALTSLSGFVSDAVTELGTLPGRVVAAVGDLGSVLYQSGKDLIQGLIDGILDMLGPLGTAIGWVGDKIAKLDVPGWSPPGPAGYKMGKTWTGGIVQGIQANYAAISDAVEGVGDIIADAPYVYTGPGATYVNNPAAGDPSGSSQAPPPPPQYTGSVSGDGTPGTTMGMRPPEITVHQTFHVEDRSIGRLVHEMQLGAIELGRQLQDELGALA